MGTALHLAHRNLPLSSWPPGLTRGESRIYNKATLHWHPWEFCNFGGSPAKPTARGGGPRALLTTRIQDSTPKAHGLWRGCFLEGHKAWTGPPGPDTEQATVSWTTRSPCPCLECVMGCCQSLPQAPHGYVCVHIPTGTNMDCASLLYAYTQESTLRVHT